ncbi:MAG: tRNA lysidine(34) synthetase TilS [Candidatus Eremiobacteraeota bacterium]|nr:tRNA lysidine(34) synthetase TilS [Candidatus Eremiobacteraeota bacterium]
MLRERALLFGRRLTVACSGGADSVALVALVSSLSERLELQLRLAYVHHPLRRSAWQDECVVLRIAASFGLPVDTLPIDPDSTDEATLRERRYGALAEHARTWGNDAVVTAHHAQDQSESVLLALFRGAGERGLGGMRVRRTLAEGVDLLRPLLAIDGEALHAYCHARALPYAVDPSNASLDVRRNAVRDALDALRPRFPGLDRAVARAATIAGNASENEEADRGAARRWLSGALARRFGRESSEFERVEALLAAIEGGASGRYALGGGASVLLRDGKPVNE